MRGGVGGGATLTCGSRDGGASAGPATTAGGSSATAGGDATKAGGSTTLSGSLSWSGAATSSSSRSVTAGTRGLIENVPNVRYKKSLPPKAANARATSSWTISATELSDSAD